MTEDASQRLLAAVEALHEEVRAMRKEAREDRMAREMLAERKFADAARQARYRKRNVTSRDNHVTPEVVSSSVVDLKSVEKEQLPPASRNGNVTSRNGKATAATWEAYSVAYEAKYHAPPKRNATTNSQMAQVVKRLGEEEAPSVAAFYVGLNTSFYIQKLHPVGLLLQNAEPIRTQWATGRNVTATEANQQDRTQANFSGWADLLSQEGRDALAKKRT